MRENISLYTTDQRGFPNNNKKKKSPLLERDHFRFLNMGNHY